ncbi:placenta growth factor, partial [Polypterus senegalus]|uniref:placenta growth factor n=1 Tax=Polypterus senegalus TaxID=55291 RepID=UPI001965071C
MRFFICLVKLITALLPLSPAQILSSSSVSRTSEVMPFQEVYRRSFCRTIEKLVDVIQDYPNELEHIFSPSCVPLLRCAGCCGDENLECVPVKTYNVTMQLLKIKRERQEYIEMTFIEHQSCECRQKKDTIKLERRKQRGKG